MRARAFVLIAPILLSACETTVPTNVPDEPLLAMGAGSPRFTDATAVGPGNSGELFLTFAMTGLGAKASNNVTGSATADAVWACRFGSVFDGWPAPQTISQAVTTNTVATSKNGRVNGSLTLAAPANPLTCSAAHSAALVSDNYSGAMVSHPDAVSRSIAGTYSRAFFTVPSEVFPVITAATIASTTIDFGGPLVAFSATIDNAGPARSPVIAQQWITQGASFKAAGGFSPHCGGAAGDLPEGTCTIQGSAGASNASTGSGTLVPGPAVLEITLRDSPSVRVLAGWRFIITLQ